MRKKCYMLVNRMHVDSAWGQMDDMGAARAEYCKKTERRMKQLADRGRPVEVEKWENGIVLYKEDNTLMIEAPMECDFHVATELLAFGIPLYPRDKTIKRGITFFRRVDRYPVEFVE